MNTLVLRLFPDATVRRVLSWVVPIGVVAFAVLVWPYPATLGVILNGALSGGRIALIALGIALVYRSNRIINFAAADMGVAPITLVVMLVLGLGWNYWLGLGIGIVGAIVVGVFTELVIIRRFRKAPRLILTVATIGLSQLLLVLALAIPSWISGDALAGLGDRLSPPFTVNWEFGGIIFNANDIVTMVAVPLALIALALFLSRSQTGMAVRAAAERGDRAAMLGINVGRVQTIVWTLASLLAFLALFLRTGAVGLPIGSPLTAAFLIQAIGAAVIGRFERFPTIACASIAIGILDQANTFQPGNRPAFNDVMIFAIVLVALLFVRRPTSTRAGDVSNWQTVDEVRPVPAELARLPEVRGFFWGIGALVLAFVLLVPTFLSEAKLSLATVIVIFSIVGVSLVVLTGWAGQVSLGQVAFMGIGGAVGGSLTSRLGWDISIAILVGGLVGAVVAVVIGYPAIRRRGLTLAVITLAFAVVTQTWLLNTEFFGDWLPVGRIERPDLFGVIDITTETSFYYFSLAILVLMLIARARHPEEPHRSRADRPPGERERRAGVRHQRRTHDGLRVRDLRLHGRRRRCALRARAERPRIDRLRADREHQDVLDRGHRWPRLAPGRGARLRVRPRRAVLPERELATRRDRRGRAAHPVDLSGRTRWDGGARTRRVPALGRRPARAGGPEPAA